MAQETPVPALVSVLSEQSFQVWGVIQTQDGLCLEVIMSCSLPVGTPVSIQTSSDFFLGHIIARELQSVHNNGVDLGHGVYLDQCLPMGKCVWPELSYLTDAPASLDRATKVKCESK